MESEPAPRVERPRPTDLTEKQLGFRRQRAVRWLDPGVLIRTGAQSLMAEIFGAFADKRELQGTLDPTVYQAGEGELWFDFVADLGDGFDATYSVASLLAAPAIQPAGATHPLPRGELLVMGGDEVYPAASTTAYEDRSKGVYRAALPLTPDGAPKLFALPGNHDWYDGLTSFLRVFAQQRNFGGWDTEQARSYFAIELPRNWWLFAIDTQFDDYVDKPQLDYFRAVALKEGDSVILCTSKPSWVPAGSNGKTKGYDTLEFFMREIVHSRKAAVPLVLTGDKHHYSRFAGPAGGPDGGRQLITCGLGGAYLAGTHGLRGPLRLPPPNTRVGPPSPPQTEYALEAQYPKKPASQRLAAGVFRLPLRNRRFWWFTTIVQAVTSLAVLFGIDKSLDTAREGTFGLLAAWVPAVLAVLLLGFGGSAFARLDNPRASATSVVAGILHAIPHVALSVGWAWALYALYHDVLPRDGVDWWIIAIFLLGTPVIGFLDAEIVAAYLLFANRFGINSNELFAAQSIEDHKGFLRMHIDGEGVLRIYPIALPRVCHQWRADPGGEPGDPWVVPKKEGSLACELIEPAVRIPRA